MTKGTRVVSTISSPALVSEFRRASQPKCRNVIMSQLGRDTDPGVRKPPATGRMLPSSFLLAQDILPEGQRSVVFELGSKPRSLDQLNASDAVDARRWGTRGIPAVRLNI